MRMNPLKSEKILVVAPHPDDETLGCGGSLLKHKFAGDSVYWMIVTNMLKEEGYDENRIKDRQKEIQAVAKGYGFDDVYKLNFPTTKLDLVPKAVLVDRIGEIVRKVKPDTVYVPNRSDVHTDHRETFDAVISTTKTFRLGSLKRILAYEVLSETEFSMPFQGQMFVPNSFSDITDFMEQKLSIIQMYRNELGEHPFPRSLVNLEAIALHRGATAGFRYAEAFMILKETW